LLLGEAITPIQGVGGAVVLVGLALAGRNGDHRTLESTWPDTACTKDLGEPVVGVEKRSVEAGNSRDARAAIREHQLVGDLPEARE
jgi:hypothetical protein